MTPKELNAAAKKWCEEHDAIPSYAQAHIAGAQSREAEISKLEADKKILRDSLEKYSDKYMMKEVIDEWLLYWMNQTQNSEADYHNYLRRAMGVDANMRHHLAKLISDIARQALQQTGSSK